MLKTASYRMLMGTASMVHMHTYAMLPNADGTFKRIPNLLISTKMSTKLFTALTGAPHPYK